MSALVQAAHASAALHQHRVAHFVVPEPRNDRPILVAEGTQNGQAVGTLSFEIPDLTDPGYGESNDQFVGWRKGVLLLPSSRLVVGDNQFQFEGPPGTAIAIRDFLLQVQYASD